MAVGRSLHVGINEAGSAFPNAGILKSPENDAQTMRDLAYARSFETDLLLGSAATSGAVVAKLRQAASVSQPDDIFLFTFAGHGTGVFDPASNETDSQDEALVLYDRLLFDNQLRMDIWPAFQAGVRVLMIDDSCHSGTVLELFHRPAGMDQTRVRELPEKTRAQHLNEYLPCYRQLTVPVYAPAPASILLLAACGDLELTPDGDVHGAFTAALLQVVQEGQATDYRDLIARIANIVGPQTPQLTALPPADEAFIAQVPFTI